MQDKLDEFMNYITANLAAIPNYADRYRHGEPIATGFVESAVNQVVSKRLVKSNKCDGRWPVHIDCYRYEPACSIDSYVMTSNNGIRSCAPIPFTRLRSTRNGPFSVFRGEPINQVLEVDLDGDEATFTFYELPSSRGGE